MFEERPADRSIVFVYGSLKKGYALHHLLENQVCLGMAVTQPFYRIFDLGQYPGLVEWPEGLAIQGELYDIDKCCLERLDDAEGVGDGLYVRRTVLLQSPHNDINAYAWFWLHPVTGFEDCGCRWG